MRLVPKSNNTCQCSKVTIPGSFCNVMKALDWISLLLITFPAASTTSVILLLPKKQPFRTWWSARRGATPCLDVWLTERITQTAAVREECRTSASPSAPEMQPQSILGISSRTLNHQLDQGWATLWAARATLKTSHVSRASTCTKAKNKDWILISTK